MAVTLADLFAASGAVTKRPAKGWTRPGEMNATEAEYASRLEYRRLSGEVLWWRYEALTLVLAKGTRYTPDFAVMLADSSIEIHETKGFMRDDAAVKLKVAAEMFPFRFLLVRRDKGSPTGWKEEEI